jgi:hypothetical protein
MTLRCARLQLIWEVWQQWLQQQQRQLQQQQQQREMRSRVFMDGVLRRPGGCRRSRRRMMEKMKGRD